MQRVDRRDREKDTATHRLGVALMVSVSLHALYILSGPVGWRAPVPQVGIRLADGTQDLPVSGIQAQLIRWKPTDVAAIYGDAVFAHVRELAPDANFYRAEQLDVLPMLRNPVDSGNTLAGRVSLLTRIDASGRVVDVSVFDTDPVHADASAAMQLLRGMSFRPGLRYGRAVRSEVLIELAGKAARQ